MQRSSKVLVFAALWIGLVSSSPAGVLTAQESVQQDAAPGHAARPRPRIGVALEGGGALGLAHIGVLRWFEEHHIPIDYIAGTSMGGLVAGLYATGKSPEQLEQLVREQNWDVIIGGETPYRDLSYRQKQDARMFQNPIVMGLKHGLSLPSALNAGRDINLLIDRETLAYPRLDSFDELPIPFRCVATELVSGKEVVFSSGYLAQALRSTMSIPGVFAPVHDGDKIYVDGGLVGNLPTDVVRQMGADVVIGVHLEVAPADPQKIQSMFSVLGRSIDVLIRDNEIRGLENADLVVKVDLRAYNSMEYEKAQTIIQLGQTAAEEKQAILAPYSLPDADWQDYLEARRTREKTVVPVPQFVRIEGTDPKSAEHLEQFLSPLVGKPVDTATIDHFLRRLTGIGKYDSVNYRLSTENGKTGLIVTAHEITYAPPTLRIGFEVDGSESNDVTFTQLMQVTFMDVAGFRSEWRNNFEFGNTYGIQSELYRPFNSATKWFFAPRGDATNMAFKIYSRSNPIADYRIERADIGGDVGYGFSHFTELRVGYEVGYYSANLRLGQPDFFSYSGRLGDTRVHFLTDHRDDPVVPSRGYNLEGIFRWYDTNPGATSAFPLIQGKGGYFHPVSDPGSVFAVAEGGSSFGYSSIGVPQFFLGGPGRLSAYGTNELFGNEYYNVRLGYLHRLMTLPPFVGKSVYAIGAYEFGYMWDFPSESRFPNDGTAGVIAETILGPFFVGASIGDTGHKKWFFQLGHVF